MVGRPFHILRKELEDIALKHDTSDEPRQPTGRRLLIVNNRTWPTVKSGNSNWPVVATVMSISHGDIMVCKKFGFILIAARECGRMTALEI